MNEFELFVREQAQNYPSMSLQTLLNLWNKKQGLAPDFDNDPVEWAKAIPGVVDFINEGRLIPAVKAIREFQHMNLLQAKNLAQAVGESLGKKYYG